jgi:hypothetical protein
MGAKVESMMRGNARGIGDVGEALDGRRAHSPDVDRSGDGPRRRSAVWSLVRDCRSVVRNIRAGHKVATHRESAQSATSSWVRTEPPLFRGCDDVVATHQRR